jgi:hypothetical protein
MIKQKEKNKQQTVETRDGDSETATGEKNGRGGDRIGDGD